MHFRHENLVILSLWWFFSLALFNAVSCYPGGAILNDDAAELLTADERQSLMEQEAPKFLKRAGFVGMRGKKSNLLDDDDEEEVNGGDMIVRDGWMDAQQQQREMAKRGNSGFVGMRGKKASGPAQMVEVDPAWFEQFLTAGSSSKRAGFVGMRGKKAGFVGMRGKKGHQQQHSYFDLPVWSNQLSLKTRRGSSGFVGMRG